MPSYRVKRGHAHGAFKQHKAGAVVKLTEQEAAGFLDKLELVEADDVLNIDAPTSKVGGFVVSPAGTLGLRQPGETPGSAVTPPDAPAEPFDVAAATVEDVIAAVEAERVSAGNALIAEQQGKKRVSLLRELERLAAEHEA